MEKMEKLNPYLKLALMLIVSFIIMYSVMFLNVFELNHIYLSTTRTYMALIMTAPMSISMLLFMWQMYKDKRMNCIIIAISILIFTFSVYSLRNQTFIKDVQWMEAMIPHHSSAILTSKNAHLEDPEVQKLADEIIVAQEKEIAEMKILIERLK